MKKIFSTVLLLLLTVSITTSVFAQKQKSRDELIKEIAALSNSQTPGDKDKAYELCKEFLSRFAKDKEAAKVKSFAKNYQKFSFYKASDEGRFADFFAKGKEILTEEPENTEVALNLAYAGYDALLKKNDKSFSQDSIAYAQLTLSLLEKGLIPTNYAPFNTKEDALAWMYFIIGYFSMEKDGKTSAANFYKSTLYESPIKNTSQPYIAIAMYYEDRYEMMSKALNAKVKTISDAEFKTETDKINVIIEQMMDAYARAYKMSEKENNPARAEWKNRLAAVYKFYKKTDAGFEPYLTYVVTTAFKDPANF
ncbi:MAG: hypothetical protein AAB336_09055 [Acidobacteriota bacterium]